MARDGAEVRPIEEADVDAVAEFLHRHLNPRVPPSRWRVLLAPPWPVDAPNHGFQLVTDAGIVGAYVAVYADREVGGERLRFCNLAAFCVLEDYRGHSVRLLRAILGQPGLEFTDLSPSGNVVALNQRLGFTPLDTATRLTLNLPGVRKRGIRVSTDPAVIEHTLTGRDAEYYRDHRDAPAAGHLVATDGDGYAYLITRKDRRKRVPLFASAVYAGGDRGVLREAWPQVRTLLLRRGALATLAERRVLGFDAGPGIMLRAPRAKMFRSNAVPAEAVDYLYSELTLLQW